MASGPSVITAARMPATISRLEKRGPVRVIGVRGATATRSERLKSVIVWILTRGLKSTSLVGANRYNLNRLKAANTFVVEAWLGAENPSATISKEHPPVSASGAGGVHPARRFWVAERRAVGLRLRYGVPTHHRRVNESTRLGRMPDAVYEPTACIRATLEAANRTGFDRSRLSSS
jgi:hypothetical protein